MNAVPEKPVAETAAVSQPQPRARRGAGAVLKPLAALGVLIAAGIGAAWWFGEGRYIESTDNAYVQGDIAVLSPQVSGRVKAILAADNQRVKAGEPLLSIDPADLEAQRDEARGQLAEATAAAVTANRQVDQARIAIVSAKANIDQAQAELVRATKDADRSKVLTGSGWTSRQSDETVVATAQKAEAALIAARAQEQAAEQALSVAQAQAAQAEAHARTARAALVLAENNLGYATIRAPFDGIVGNRAAQLGQLIAPGQQIIAIAPLPEHLYVVANFKETQLRRMKPGQKVRLIPDIDPAAAVDARVDSIAPATGALFSLLPPENATGNFTKIVQRVPVKLVLDAEQAKRAGWLRAGLSVTAEVDTRGPDAVRLGVLGAAAAAFGLR
jgi:membrane fusion protein (multidrug efflux system)